MKFNLISTLRKKRDLARMKDYQRRATDAVTLTDRNGTVGIAIKGMLVFKVFTAEDVRSIKDMGKEYISLEEAKVQLDRLRYEYIKHLQEINA